MSVTRFRFDTAFDGGTARVEAARQADEAQKLAQARADGEAVGFARGHAQALAETEAATLACCTRIGSALADALHRLDQRQRIAQSEAAGLALAIAEQLSAGLTRRLPQERVLALVDSLLADVMSEPRLVIRVSDALLDAVKARIDADAARLGYPGRLIFLGEPSFDAHEVSVEWAGGGLDGRAAPLTAQMHETIDSFIAGVLQPGATTTEG